jgi:hypothetical protein
MSDDVVAYRQWLAGLTPQQRRFRITFALFASVSIFGAFFTSIAVQFVPTHPATLLGSVPAIIMGSLGAYVGANPKGMPTSRPKKWLQSPMARTFILGIFMFWATWQTTVYGVFAVYTWATGTPGEQQFVVAGWTSATRRGCGGPSLKGTAFGTRICVDRARSAEFQPGTTAVLHGRVSVFGIRVESVSSLGSRVD